MDIALISIAAAAALSTYLGGRLALRFKDNLHLIIGFSAGAVVGVAFFDLLPEAIDAGSKFFDVSLVTTVVALGFVVYMLIDRLFSLSGGHSHGHSDAPGASDESGRRGHIGAGSLTLHSFLDGLGVGLAFQISAALGTIVTIAVLVHDFSDGINTVNMSIFGGGSRAQALRWLAADALAPAAGIASTFFFRLPEHYFALILALFTGFFLYIGASELLPESHHRHPRLWTSIATVIGMAVIYFAIHAASF